MISDLRTSDPLVQKITTKLRARLPQASAIIFFGSRVAGCADEFSDYDVMIPSHCRANKVGGKQDE
jgi:predicted nucleotidyltransferase